MLPPPFATRKMPGGASAGHKRHGESCALEVHQAGPTTVVAGCDRFPRGTKYLFTIMVVGRDPVQETRRDPQITVENLPPGGTVKITAQARNAAGKSTATAPVEVKLG